MNVVMRQHPYTSVSDRDKSRDTITTCCTTETETSQRPTANSANETVLFREDNAMHRLNTEFQQTEHNVLLFVDLFIQVACTCKCITEKE